MTARQAPLPVGLLGLGRMGRVYLEVLLALPEARLVAVADPRWPQIREELAAWPLPQGFLEAQDLLARPDIEAVVIATPTPTHADLVEAAAREGKAVFCEKPLALTLEDTLRALRAVRQARVPLQVGFMRRYDAAYRRAWEWIRQGAIGRPLVFKAVGRDPFCPDPAFADPRVSGGLVLDMAIHDFDLARWLMQDEVVRVSGEGALLVCQDLRPVGDLDQAVINLRFAGGAIGNVEVSRTAFYGYDIRTEVLGSEGAVLIGGHRHTPALLLTRQGAHFETVPYLMERFGPAYREQLRAFVQAVRAGKPVTPDGQDALRAFLIAQAARRAVETGQPQAVPEPPDEGAHSPGRGR